MAGKKSNNKLVSFIVIAVILIVSALITSHFGLADDLFNNAGLTNIPADGIMRVNFINVGQGDCTLITCGDKAMLVDAGETGEAQTVINYIKNQGVKRLDCVIATHPHSDHIGGMSKVLNEFEIGDVIMPEISEKITPTTSCYEKLLDAIANRAENAYFSEVGDKYEYGGISFTVFAPTDDYDDLNNMSVVVKVSYGQTSVMLTGDAETTSESDMLKNNFDYSADILKLGHHGSKTSSSAKWLKAVDPKCAVISCGEGNSYGHPHKETVNKLLKYNIEFLRTDLMGDIVFESDGTSFKRIDN